MAALPGFVVPDSFTNLECADFEYARGSTGDPYRPTCMVVHNLTSGRTKRMWREELFAWSAAQLA